MATTSTDALRALPPDVAEALQGFEGGVAEIEVLMRRLQAAPWAEICACASPLESARAHLLVAYTVHALYYMYLKTQGTSPAGHPVKDELDRVKRYIAKLRDFERREGEAAEGAAEGAPRARLDVAAAQRFVAGALRGEGGGEGSGATSVAGEGSADGGGGGEGGGEGGGGGLGYAEASARAAAAAAGATADAAKLGHKVRKELRGLRAKGAAPAEGATSGADAAAAAALSSTLLEQAAASGLELDGAAAGGAQPAAEEGAAAPSPAGRHKGAAKERKEQKRKAAGGDGGGGAVGAASPPGKKQKKQKKQEKQKGKKGKP